jgi:hypothetical protein
VPFYIAYFVWSIFPDDNKIVYFNFLMSNLNMLSTICVLDHSGSFGTGIRGDAAAALSFGEKK